MLRFDVFARTEVGCARERNEDSFLVLNLATGDTGLLPDVRTRDLLPPGTLVAVCDGMGGAAAGDLASKLALGALEQVVRAQGPIGSVDVAEATLLQAVTTANRTILDFAKAHPDKRGMGTTMTAALLFGDEIVIVQVGDSRAYLKRGHTLQQLTMDQNVVGQMIATGRISPDQARNVKQRNMLLEAIGVQEKVGPDLVRVRVQPGDIMLLCSDGLTGPLDDPRVLEILLRHEDPVPSSRALTEAACAAGGPDNVTVALVRFHGQTIAPVSTDATISFVRRTALA
ncbi:MAG: serine/threonine-protein phosphatase [Deltaproteobacteria bacterium]|nr:serine/threonine-protein phosphatase [Deltaproteobacteria bacterium]MBK8237550.1 serine/threonine-protein phosphatase [Deltaproteobacteria bacterium]MBP7291473.1 serine/threonine-protein phosphatase [Nannocystaceae bacterium]